MKAVEKQVWAKVDELRKEGKLPIPTEEDLADEPTALANSQYRLDFDETDEEPVYNEDIKKQMLTEKAKNHLIVY